MFMVISGTYVDCLKTNCKFIEIEFAEKYFNIIYGG